MRNESDLWVPEFEDFIEVLEFGAEKHGRFNWLDVNGKKSSHKDMHASMFRHVAESYCGRTQDEETGLHPLLHATCRSLMYYTRWKRGLLHDEDLQITRIRYEND